MGRKLVFVVDAGCFTLDGRVVKPASMLELQLEGDHWLGGTITPAHDGMLVFALRLGGPHERHGAIGPATARRRHGHAQSRTARAAPAENENAPSSRLTCAD